jgi:hypothetical protein
MTDLPWAKGPPAVRLTPANMVTAKMAGSRRLLLLAGLILVLGLSFLSVRLWPTGPHGGLSQAAAVQIAWTHVNTGATGVLSAEIRHDFHTGFDIPIHDQAWVVTFTGQWHLLCVGGCDPTTEWVAIDYYTGEWIASEYSYPQRR